MTNGQIKKALTVLVQLHKDQDALVKIRDLGGLQHENVAQGAIAGLVRYLMRLRDAG